MQNESITQVFTVWTKSLERLQLQQFKLLLDSRSIGDPNFIVSSISTVHFPFQCPKLLIYSFNRGNKKYLNLMRVISLPLCALGSYSWASAFKTSKAARERWVRRVTDGGALTRVMVTRVMDDFGRMPCQQRGEDKYLAAFRFRYFCDQEKICLQLLSVCARVMVMSLCHENHVIQFNSH